MMRHWLDNKKDILGKRAVNPFLSGSLQNSTQQEIAEDGKSIELVLILVTFRQSFKFVTLFSAEILPQPETLTKMLTNRQTDIANL